MIACFLAELAQIGANDEYNNDDLAQIGANFYFERSFYGELRNFKISKVQSRWCGRD